MPSAHSVRYQQVDTSAKRRRILPNRFINAVIGRGGTVNLPCENECDIKRAFYEAEGSIMFNDPSGLWEGIHTRTQASKTPLEARHGDAYVYVPRTISDALTVLSKTRFRLASSENKPELVEVQEYYTKRIAMVEDVLTDLFCIKYEDYSRVDLNVRRRELMVVKKQLLSALSDLRNPNLLCYDITDDEATSNGPTSSHVNAMDVLRELGNTGVGRELHSVELSIAKDEVCETMKDYTCSVSLCLMDDPVTIYAVDPSIAPYLLARHYERKRYVCPSPGTYTTAPSANALHCASRTHFLSRRPQQQQAQWSEDMSKWAVRVRGCCDLHALRACTLLSRGSGYIV